MIRYFFICILAVCSTTAFAQFPLDMPNDSRRIDIDLIGFWALEKVEISDSSMVDGHITVKSFVENEMHSTGEQLIHMIEILPQGYGVIDADTVIIEILHDKLIISNSNIQERMFDYGVDKSDLLLKDTYFTNNDGVPVKKGIAMYFKRR